MADDTQCDICSGTGTYPIFDCHGTERYNVECPECGGAGTVEAPDTGEIAAQAAESRRARLYGEWLQSKSAE